MGELRFTIDPQELRELMEQAGDGRRLVVADCRFPMNDPEAGEAAYRAAHIPGAVYLHLERELSGPKQPGVRGGRHPLPEPEALAAVLGEKGIDEETYVVAYDDQGGSMAGRLLWLLEWLGHKGGASLLAGGFAAWQGAGYPVTDEPSTAETRQYVPELQPGIAVDAAYVRERLGRPGVTLVDSREAPRYRGETEPLDPVAGHIPGAVNRFWKDSFDASGRLRSAEEQQERFGAIDKGDEVIVYCGSGVTATPNYFALREAGYNVKLYPGSWSDWVSDKGNPIGTGDEEGARGK